MNYPKEHLGNLLTLEYGSALPEQGRTGFGFPVFGSNGEIGRHSRCLIKGPGIVVGRKGSVGEVRWSKEDFWPIDTTYFVVPKEGVNVRWLFWLLGSLGLKKLDAATGVPGLNRNDVYALLSYTPTPEDQLRVAKILDTADDAIAKTEAVIVKLRQARAGLLHDLLTLGLDQNGSLRNPMAHPEKFQDSPFGPIPEEWNIRHLTEVATFQNGKSFPSREYRDSGIRLLRPGNLPPSEYVSWEPESTIYLPESWAESASEYLVGEGEVVMNLTAQSLEDQFLGRVCITRNGECCLLNQRLARFMATDCHLPFLFWSLRGPQFRLQIDRTPKGTKIQHLYNRDLESIILPIPNDLEEQERIASTLFMMAAKIESEEIYIAKLVKLKSGLMLDLLTGRVRVPEDLELAK